MKPIYDFIVWALKRAKKATVPQGAILPINNNLVGSDGEWEYLYGTSGKKVTQALLDERWKNHYSTTQWTRESYLKATAGWVERGVIACDCQGLLDQYLGSDTTANGNYIKYCTGKGKITEINRPWVIGEAVFNGTDTKKTHVGWVCGFMPNGEPVVVHARGLAYGVVINSFSEFKWTYRGLMTNIFKYSEDKPMAKIIKLTTPLMRGSDIKALQDALNGLGYDCGKADGIAGQKTLDGIKAFVAAHSEPQALPDKLNVHITAGNTVYTGTIKR